MATRQRAAHDHGEILQAIVEHNADSAEEAMLRHLEHVSQALRGKGQG